MPSRSYLATTTSILFSVDALLFLQVGASTQSPFLDAASVTTAVAVLALSVVVFRTQRHDQQRAQATSVYATAVRSGETQVILTIHNRSDLPIYGVRARPRLRGGFVDDGLQGAMIDVSPEDNEDIAWSVPTNLLGELHYLEPRPWLSFSDSSGRQWERQANGRRTAGERQATPAPALVLC